MIMIPALASMSTHCLHLSVVRLGFAAAKIHFFSFVPLIFQKCRIFALVLWRSFAAVIYRTKKRYA